MFKKIVSLLLCILMLVPVFASCSKVDENNKGAYVKMYITEPVYNFDPARAFGNEAALKVVSLLFDNLFILGENGKVKKSLAKSYEIIEDEKTDEYKMIITLRPSAWSDGVVLSANDVVFAWKRILDSSNSFEAASLLYDIKNAREAKEGDTSIDNVGIYALNETQVEIFFKGKIDYDRFLLNLTSYALCPLRENIINLVENDYDWAKKATLFAASGPFKLRQITYEKEAAGLVLERNDRYLRDTEKDALDKSVKPYRLLVDFTMSDADLMTAYENGEIFYIGNIPFSVRKDWKDSKEVEKSDALSTHSYMLNQNAIIRYYDEAGFENLATETTLNTKLEEGKDGEKLFANPIVREALSLAIDRQAIADTVVFAKPATGLVPNGVFNTTSKRNTFRDAAGDALITSNEQKANELLTNNNIDAGKYMFSISVPAYDTVHMEIAKMVQAAWTKLGFHVAIQAIDVIDNTHIDKTTKEAITNIKDDVFAERYAKGDFEVAAIDYSAFSVDAFSVLAPFAKGFTGGAAAIPNTPDFEIPTHITGYNSEEYNAKIEEAFAADDNNTRAEKLHEAEEILMKDLPVIPVIFNENATLTSKDLSGEKVTYYGTPIFTKLNLKNYEEHIPAGEVSTTKKDEETEAVTTAE